MSGQLQVPALTRQAWKERRAREIGARAKDYSDELRLIDALLADAAAGHVWLPDGGTAFVGAKDWSDTQIQAAAGQISPGAAADDKRRFLILLGIGAVVVVLIVLVNLWPVFTSAQAAPMSKETTTPTLTESEPKPTLVAPASVDDSNQRLPLDVPRSLEIRGQPYTIFGGEVQANGSLKYPEKEEDEVWAVWFPSSANWLFGVPEKVIHELQSGDVLIARTMTGRVLRFVVSRQLTVQPQEVEQLSQRRAGLTLFPLPSSSSDVDLIFARYDPSSEQPIAPTPDARVGTPVAVSNGQVFVSGTSTTQRADRAYEVSVSGQTSLALVAPILEVEGQVYPASSDIVSGTFTVTFIVPGLGQSAFVAGEKRIDLGLLVVPQLTAQITGVMVNLTPASLDVALVVTASGGAAYVQSSDLVLLPTGGSEGGEDMSEVAPLSLLPASVMVSPDQPANLTARFALAPGVKTVRLRLFDHLYAVTLP